MKKLRPHVKGVAMKVRKLFSKTETSSGLLRTSNSVRNLGLKYYDLGMRHDGHKCLLQLLANIYPNINDGCMFKINKLGSKLCNDSGHITNNDALCID